MISVVIPAYNAAATIDEQLAALAGEQAESPWEVIVADNGSTDRTRARVAVWAERLPDLRVVDAGQRRGTAHARNVGVAAARGNRILMCDADDVVAPGWVDHLGAALIEHPLVGGLLDRAKLNPQFATVWRDRTPVTGPRVQHEHLPFVPSGNLGFRRALFDALEGFDESLRRGADMDFSWRAHGVGTIVHVVPEAIVYFRLPATPSGWLRRGYVDGVSTVQLYARHRATGMQRPSSGQALRAYAALFRDVSTLRHGRPAACIWAYDFGLRAGRLWGSVRHRTLFV